MAPIVECGLASVSSKFKHSTASNKQINNNKKPKPKPKNKKRVPDRMDCMLV